MLSEPFVFPQGNEKKNQGFRSSCSFKLRSSSSDELIKCCVIEQISY